MDYSNKFRFARNTNWKNKSYTYLKNVIITEWDISSAGLSVIKYKKLLPKDEIDKLSNMTKKMRTIREGLFQKENPLLAEKIVTTLEDIREVFVSANDISEDNVLSIKKDALFIINKNPSYTKIFDEFLFREKGKYTSFVLLNKAELYLKTDGSLDVKGIPSESVECQEKFILKDIAHILKMAEKVNQEQLYTILKNYRNKYLNRELPVETYRELDSGLYRINSVYMSKEIDKDLLNDIDITQNYMNYILPLIKILL